MEIKWIENDFAKTVFVGFIGKLECFNIDKHNNTFKLWDSAKQHCYYGSIEELKLKAIQLIRT